MLSRSKSEYEDLSNKFRLTSFDYHKQYSHFYAHRLREMTSLLSPLAEEHWSNKYAVKKLCDLREEQTETCIIIGTIYKHQAHKPSILREISEENQLAPQPPREHYADLEDKLILEDELQRVRLYGKVDGRFMSSGVVCAVLGSIEEDGRFDVEEILYYEAGPQKPLPNKGYNRKLVLLSGINCTGADDYIDELNLFQHWLCGNVFGKQNSKIVRIIVAGNSVGKTTEESQTASLQTRNNDNNGAVEAICAIDGWFASWSKSVSIDIMPGAHDPANFMLPQQPFHQFMFPKASKSTSFRSVPNPYAFSLDNNQFVGCSGQNINDLLRCTMIEKPLEALRSTLIWGHLAPTAPDTLACYPYVDTDPLILQECPHVYFAGNCDVFETDLHKGSKKQTTRLICVPNFSKTQSIAVVDLDTLDCKEIIFKTDK
ncbi:PREDICTED: DNA polymerase delta small subunit [Bactrocera latifrons]|uniref:DNA polymerase delta subunit 2 n=1 Tax=Bactrocera latifrons TaxID=174628 RepID=A0A0K8V6A7_BACLA|nr:PREDICTED: DNA polymerase delta small subunit [Bactrocera latifrons]